MTNICEICGKEFEPTDKYHPKQKTCSRQCQIIKQKIFLKNYEKTAKRKEYCKNRRKTQKWKDWDKKYRQKQEYKNYRKNFMEKYAKTYQWKKWYEQHKPERRIADKKYRDRTRSEILSKFTNGKNCCEGLNGAECTSNCGPNGTNPNKIDLLELDHINGGGNRHRKKTKRTNLYFWIFYNNIPKNGFRILCSNCNKIEKRRIAGKNKKDRIDILS